MESFCSYFITTNFWLSDTVTFDNSYSLMRSKKLHYCVDVTPPLNKMNIIPTEEEIEKINETPEETIKVKDQTCGVSSGSNYVPLSVKG